MALDGLKLQCIAVATFSSLLFLVHFGFYFILAFLCILHE